jgi:hypothetical protein
MESIDLEDIKMVERFEDIIEYMLNDPDWEVPKEQRAAQVASMGTVLIHS